LRWQLEKRNSRRSTAFLFVTALALSVAALKTAARPDNPPPGDAVGVIEGEAIAVTGPMSVDTVNGQIVTMLRSGSDVRVKSGSARIKLVEGGQISICGPAHLSVLKSGAALTIALDTGTIHAHIERQPLLTMYTPQIQAQPVAIGDGAQDTVIGFDAAGAMCIRTNRGALRLEQQLTGQSVLVPQGGDVFLSSGQIDSLRTSSTPGHCSCELQIVEAPPPQPEISHLATAEEVRRKVEDVKPKLPTAEAPKPSAPKEEPIYQVFVPPLIFDAKAAVQPEVDTKMIVLIRRVRVRPTLIFQGRVEGDLVAVKEPVPAISGHPLVPAAAAPGSAAAPAGVPPVPKPPPKKEESLTERVRTLVRKLWP
jgi:hypothetical protein